MKAQIQTSETPPVSLAVSGFFDNEQAIEQAMHGCLQRGIPRDLIEVAVSPQAAPRFFGARRASPAIAGSHGPGVAHWPACC